MRVGLIVEGKSDAAVITNILKGKLNVSKTDVQYLSPELDNDETSLFEMKKEQFSNWTIVKTNCQNREKFDNFFKLDDDAFIVIHIDSDVRNEVGYEVTEPKTIAKQEDLERLRETIVTKINEWLNNEFIDKVVFAVAIEEIDAWIMALFPSTGIETGFLHNPKERLQVLINTPNLFTKKQKQEIFSLKNDKLKQYALLSNDFRKEKTLLLAASKNYSLRKFCEELEKFKEEVLMT